jgi:acyl carrier protein
MTDKEIVDLIDASLAEEFELDRDAMVPTADIFEELGLDSLDIVDMVIVLERAFGFKIRQEGGMQKIKTLADIHAYVTEKVRSQEG